jgi:predicted nucleic acid binding AN1-type Zn finger protein
MKNAHGIIYGPDDKLPIVDDASEYPTALAYHQKKLKEMEKKQDGQNQKKLAVDQQFQDYLSQPFKEPFTCPDCGGTFGNMRAYLAKGHKH